MRVFWIWFFKLATSLILRLTAPELMSPFSWVILQLLWWWKRWHLDVKLCFLQYWGRTFDLWMPKVYENHTKQVLETLCGLPVFGVRCWGWAPLSLSVCLMLPNNFWFLRLNLQKKWCHCNQSWLCRLQELHRGVVPGSFLLQPGSLSHQEWVFRVPSGLALQTQIEWPCLEVIFFFPSQCRNAVKVAELSQLEELSSPSVCHRQPARHFSYKYFQHFFEATYFGVVPTPLSSCPLCPSLPPPHGGHLMVSGEIPPRARAQEFLQSWTTLWVFPGLDSIDKRLCSQPRWPAHVFI